jgi:hypothetical protein
LKEPLISYVETLLHSLKWAQHFMYFCFLVKKLYQGQVCMLEKETVLVNVTNNAKIQRLYSLVWSIDRCVFVTLWICVRFYFANGMNAGFCRHGARQFRNGWADGPADTTMILMQQGKEEHYGGVHISLARGYCIWCHCYHA